MIVYIPMVLINELNENNKTLKDLDKAIKEAYHNLDPYNDTPEYFIMSIQGNMNISPVISKDLIDFGKAFVLNKKNNNNMPIYLRPHELIENIKYEKINDALMSTPEEFSNVFSMPTIRPAQLELLKQLKTSKSRVKTLIAPTGIGKTLVILSYAKMRNLKTLIVEPDRGTENQLLEKYNVNIIKGMNNYKCLRYNTTADVSPCRVNNKKCGKGCPWYDAREKARLSLLTDKILACNPGNMFQYIPMADIIIIDEYHMVFSMISNSHKIDNDIDNKSGLSYLTEKYSLLNQEAEDLYYTMKQYAEEDEEIPDDLFNEYKNIQNEISWISIFIENYNDTYIYKDKYNYIKMDKSSTVKWFSNKYKDKEIIYVSATPLTSGGDIIKTNKSVAKQINAPVVYFPVANMSYSNINDDYIEAAADVIRYFYTYFSDHGKTKKVIVHSGNTSYAQKIAYILESYNIKTKYHEKGNLDNVIKEFKENNYDVLCVASANAGYDFYGTDFGLQFILKVPYPSLNNEWVALENKYGKSYRWESYAKETVDAIMQASGRICRGSDDAGMTLILDAKFKDLFNNFSYLFSDDFKERLIDLSSELNNIPKNKIDYYIKQ